MSKVRLGCEPRSRSRKYRSVFIPKWPIVWLINLSNTNELMGLKVSINNTLAIPYTAHRGTKQFRSKTDRPAVARSATDRDEHQA